VRLRDRVKAPGYGRKWDFSGGFGLFGTTEALRNKAGLEKLPDPAIAGISVIVAQARSLDSTQVTANSAESKRVKGLKVLAWK
jgi:hypothetical protein